MARVCEICSKRTRTGMSIARRGLAKRDGGVGLKTTGHNKRKFLPNLQRIRAIVDGKAKRLTVCTRCIKSGRVIKPLYAAAAASRAAG
ncbi:MAG: 50S ribosomal protein L28 [Planctomycetes bacterium]|nr:50S ribosomal protein L28 [Planctomycetota bacterium]